MTTVKILPGIILFGGLIISTSIYLNRPPKQNSSLNLAINPKLRMKIIKPNEIKTESLPDNIEKTSLLDAIKDFVKIKGDYIQYVKGERDDELLKCYMNPFVEAAHIAYSYHVPLTITPDLIFYLITSATAVHINQNAEKLRNLFVNHEGKKELEVKRDDFIMYNKSNPWHEVINEFSIAIKNNTNNNVTDLLVANFSTTSNVTRVVSQMVLMDSMQKYFDFKFTTMCGIPEIRLTGNKEDWVNVKRKTNDILKLIPDLKLWIDDNLNEILDHFIGAFDNKIDKSFWNQIYKCKFSNFLLYVN